MRTKNDIIKSSENNNNFLSSFHWSYPFDCGLMNKKNFDNYKNLTSVKKNYYKTQLSDLIILESRTNTFSINIKNPGAFNVLFTYINPENIEPSTPEKYKYIQYFFDGFNSLITKYNYSHVLNHTIDSIDVFGLGFSLQYILNCFYRHKVIDPILFKRLSAFFYKMYDFNPETREINIDNLLNEYETILQETGILTRLQKTFENNNLINTKQVRTNKTRKVKGK